jgi:hypothetical protein
VYNGRVEIWKNTSIGSARRPVRSLLAPGQLADAPHRRHHVVQPACPDRLDAITALAELVDRVRRHAALPDQQEVGPQQGELFLVHGKGIADLGQLQDLFGVVGPGACTDEQFSGAHREHHFGEMRRKRDDPLRGPGLGVRRALRRASTG